MAIIIVPDDAGTIALGLAAMGAADELQIRGNNYAEGNLVVGTGAVIRKFPGDPVPVVVLGDGVNQTWRIHTGITFQNIISENGAGIGSVVYKVNVAGVSLIDCAARNYTGRAVQTAPGADAPILTNFRSTAAGAGAEMALDLQASSGGFVVDPIIDGTHVAGMKPGNGMSVWHPTIVGCTDRAYDDDQGASLRNGVFKSNPGTAVWLDHAAADADYLDLNGNGTNTWVVAGTLGAHLWTDDPLFVDEGAGDYHLQAGSPARKKGIDLGVAIDFDNNPRPCGPTPCLGAYEFQDWVGPVITHTPVASSHYGEAVPLTAHVVDALSGVAWVRIYYRTTGTTVPYVFVAMTLLVADIYGASIPGAAVVTPGVDYYIAAEDGVANLTTHGTP